MKLQYLTICAALAMPTAFARGDSGQKQFGSGTCLPKYLEQYDVDGDGVIGEEERQVMEQARDQIREHLRQGWDEDGDGQLCEQEREHAREQLRQMMEEKRNERFNEADTDDDGYVSKEEFAVLPGISKMPAIIQNMIFAKFDADGDGSVSSEEFLAVCDGPNHDAGNGGDNGNSGGGNNGGSGGSGGPGGR